MDNKLKEAGLELREMESKMRALSNNLYHVLDSSQYSTFISCAILIEALVYMIQDKKGD